MRWSAPFRAVAAPIEGAGRGVGEAGGARPGGATGRRRLYKVACVALVAAVVFVPAAVALQVTYAGPKTWLQGWDQDGSYDYTSGPFYWQVNAMGPKSDDSCYPSCSSRVAFIDTSGGWNYSYTDSNSWTVRGIPEGSQYFVKKPYCKNNSSSVYTAECYATD